MSDGSPDDSHSHGHSRRIADYFILLRGRGSSLSSADLQQLQSWEDDGLSWLAIIAGIDETFRRRRRPPASLGDCARYVQRAGDRAGADLLDPALLAAAFAPTGVAAGELTREPTGQAGVASGAPCTAHPQPRTAGETSGADPAPASGAALDAEPRPWRGAWIRLDAAALDLALDARVRRALRLVADELEELGGEADRDGVEVDAGTLAVLDDAVAIAVLDQLPDAARRVLDRDAERFVAEQGIGAAAALVAAVRARLPWPVISGA